MKKFFNIAGPCVPALMCAMAALTGFAGNEPVTLTAATAEVLVAPDAQKTRSVAWFAAGEMTNFLSRAFGRAVPVVTAPTPGRTAIVVGTNAWSVAAGVDVVSLPRDGFAVRSAAGRIFIAGRDMDGAFNPAGDWKKGEKATLFGVYDFLERHVGCRFYFPGEMGEVVPRVASVAVPEGGYTDAPEFLERKVRNQLGEWYEPTSPDMYRMNEALCRYRWRLQTRGIPCCHGLQHGHYLARFGKTHPEYFCQRKDGTRMNDEEGSFPSPATYRGQYCHSSAIWDEIYKDARSYFLGESPEVRGMMAERNQRVVPGHEWRWQAAYGMYYDVMPQDNFQRCWCEKCTAKFAKSKDSAQYATELVWGRVAECAQRLIDEGIPGYLTMMSYNPYKNVPEFNIPTNVLVMVCSNGAWAKEKFQARDLKRLLEWNAKCGRKLHIWNNCGKHTCLNLNYEDMPGITPRAYGRYYKRLAPHIFGAYCDNQSEKFIYSALNYYVFSRVAWNSGVDVGALLGEYYRLMFGKGAAAMRRFDEAMEDLWMNEIISTQIETALGPMNAGISSFELWSRIVDMKRIGEFEALFREAMQAVEPGSIEARRIEFFRRQMLEPMARHAREHDPEVSVSSEFAARESRRAVSILKDFKPVEFNVTGTNQPIHAKSFRMKLKGGRTYRVSYVICGENLDQYGDTPNQLRIARMWGGVLGTVSCKGKLLGCVGRGIRGTFKPVVQAFEFVAPGEGGEEADAELKFQTFWTTGRVRIDSPLVEEMSVPAAARIDVPPQLFDAGGWKMDVQFMDAVGSPYLLAHGCGIRVADAKADVEVPASGRWRVWVRTRKWTDGAGAFRVRIGGKTLGRTFGASQCEWEWEDGGEVQLEKGTAQIALEDLDGFDGRCAGIALVKDGERPRGALRMEDVPVAETVDADFVVVGGGVPGTCAAVAAARRGLRVALVQDRPVLGGNASSEIRVWSGGEARHPLVREVRGWFMNRDANMALSDAHRLRIVEDEKTLSAHLCHRVFAAEASGGRIVSAKALDWRRNRVVRFRAPLFCDATGDGWLGFYAGADWRMGREAREEFDESLAPEKADGHTLGASLMWTSAEANTDIPFSAPWAEPHAQGVSAVRGEWNWEYGIRQDMIADGEAIRDRLFLAIYGAFSLAKREPRNSRLVLENVPFLLGKRESRRLLGDWIYSEKDVSEKRPFEDSIATGSWSIDLHYDDFKPGVDFLTTCRQPKYGRYWIPYRSIYSRNVTNLFVVGRCFSCTHVGLGGPRVINTLSQLGVAAGEAAAMCRENGCMPRDLWSRGMVRALQRRIGGDFPGNPDPSRADWRIVDDETPGVKFSKGWWKNSSGNGEQVGDFAHFPSGGDWAKNLRPEERERFAEYPLPVEKEGRYALMGRVPYSWSGKPGSSTAFEIESGGRKQQFAADQAQGMGTWRKLGEFDLSPGAILRLLPEKSHGTVVADGFAVVPVAR